VTSGKVKASNYKGLLVWQKGIALLRQTYQATSKFPDNEKYGLVSQMRRAAVSVLSNLAEGQARHSTGEFIQFICHAEGSLADLGTQLIIAIDLGFCTKTGSMEILNLLGELRQMLNSLRRKLFTSHWSLYL
jgi:four helix bundle protein